jgi:hypothetical protein
MVLLNGCRYWWIVIEQGPIVQIKSAAGKKEVLYDRDKKVEGMDLW